ncbi:hypothetical protein ACFPIK_00605 [Algoriphagus aquatilis]|uniref:Wzy n=1 Tax=Algoriphagus aquatilis TaxID=490186 RepID=A0ABW0BR04_9BACT
MKIKDIQLTNWMFSVWPIFLLVSQKALLPVQVVAFLLSRKDKILFYFMLFFITSGGFLALLWINDSLRNEFGFIHFLGFALFVISAILIGHSYRTNFSFDLKWITIFNFVSISLAIVFYVFNLDFSFFRGLNFIRGTDGAIHRVFIETTPLIVLNDYRLFKKNYLNVVLFALTFFYVFVLCKSFFIIIFFVWRLWMDHRLLIMKRIWYFLPLILLGVFFIGLELISFVIRADLALSIIFKFNQLMSIFGLISSDYFFFGRGFGFVMDEFVTDFSQPYQIEMQLPMLFLQFGLIGFLMFGIFILLIFYFSGVKRPLASTMMYFSVGFVNPWLFLPIWFLTCCYFFKKVDDQDRANL